MWSGLPRSWIRCAHSQGRPYTPAIHRAFTIAHSHYSNIDLPVISEGFAPGYTDAELDKIEKEVTLSAQDLVEKVGEEILPKSV